jgi:hypothetical protein
MNALNYAQRYQLPVFHLIDKNLANSTDMVPDIDLKRVQVTPDTGDCPITGFPQVQSQD